MNPFEIESKPIEKNFLTWEQTYPKSYNKNTVSPYTKTRVILMNGTEFESNWFLHQMARHCTDPNLKKEISIIRRQEQQQQKRISCLKPTNESFLESTIGYEQLAVDLTATLAKNEKDENNIKALNFALLEDFDHLYRYANLLKVDHNIDADCMVGKFTEIMPGRPTIAEHRHPADSIRMCLNNKKADLYSILCANIITAAEQQTMNFYMNVAQMYKNDIGRKLFAEIAMIEEQHVTQYESLKDPTNTWLECWLMHEYTECYLYYSMMQDESDEYIKNIWESHFYMEVSHLKKVSQLLKQYEGKDYLSIIPKPAFPKLLTLGENKDYVRKVLKSVGITAQGNTYPDVSKLPKDAPFFEYQKAIDCSPNCVASHLVIEKAIKKLGKDYRYQDSPHPIKELQDRKKDNTSVGRC